MTADLKPIPSRRYRQLSSGLTWRCVDVGDEGVTLSGPGPCRSVYWSRWADWSKEWEDAEVQTDS